METQTIAEGVMIFLFPAAIAVLWYFYKKDAKAHEERNKNTKQEIDALKENVNKLTEVSAKLDTMIHYHDREIQRILDKA